MINSPPIRLGSEATPAKQVLESSGTGPRLNVAGEITTSFPPTRTEIVVLKLQGTEIQKSACAATEWQR